MWKFTIPLLHRVATDPDAVTALTTMLDGTSPASSFPLLPIDAPYGGLPEHYLARRVYLVARTLKAAGFLTPERRESALLVLRESDPRITVIDPFNDLAGPLHTLGASL